MNAESAALGSGSIPGYAPQDVKDFLLSAWIQHHMISSDRKREQPIFSTKAHVFQIDPNTKKKWLPTSSQAVNVSYYYDSTRNTYRIISVDGSKAVINSTITPNMTFTKTSVKFGQWTDPRANTVYGLGFGTEAELTKFVEKFKEIKELLRQSGSGQHSSPAHTNGTPPTSNSPAPEAPNLMQAEVTGSMPSPLNSPKPSPALITQSESIHNSGSTTPSLGSSSNQVVEQLKYENDRLKIALAQSSANAKKWEVELNTLKNNNVRLTTALQESTSNVEEWKRQLASYKEEGARMKKKVLESEKAGGNSELLQRQLNDTRDKVNDMERQKNSKDEEVQQLTRRLEDMKLIDSQKQKLNERIQALERENENIRKQLTESKEQGDSIRSLQIRDRQQLRSVQEQLGSKLNELYGLNDKLAELTQQSGHS